MLNDSEKSFLRSLGVPESQLNRTWTREELMSTLNISEYDIEHHRDRVIEKLFCATITVHFKADGIAALLKYYGTMRDALYPKSA